ncbi:MAG: DegT/DnrJ/EryC1/StrS family aminotransferase [Fibrobacter sp.]|nr:DegT/DnrJ/EryC1/StrS family aminotransferase [Fibrobacter sp.]
MNIPFVDLKSQYNEIKQEIDSAISEVISNTAFIGGKYARQFEESFAKYTGVKHCVGVGNGTDALFIALKTLGIGPGDEVITAANSFIATSEAISATGARVVFVDINPKLYTIDVTKIEEKITPKTKAIIPVHLYGQPADMDPILSIAKKHNLKVIGDAAQAHGALYKGKKIAQCADMTCYSFYPGKNLGAYGDAGAIVTDNDTWAENARKFANHGRAAKYNHEFEGVNSRMDGIQGAVLGVKLNYIEDWTEKRRRNAYLYNELLQGVVTTPVELDDVRAVYHLYVVKVEAAKREAFQAFLKENGIDTGIHYPIALPYLQAYDYLNHTESDFPVSLKTSQEIVSLPMCPQLNEEQIAYVAEIIKKF